MAGRTHGVRVEMLRKVPLYSTILIQARIASKHKVYINQIPNAPTLLNTTINK